MVRFFLRRSSSLRGPPGPNRSSYFWISTRLAPNAWRLPMTFVLNPVMMPTIAITVVTPTTMPRIVSDDLSLYSMIAPTAKRTLLASPRFSVDQRILMRPSLLMTQSLHWRQLGRGGCRGEPSQQPGECSRQQPKGDETGLELSREYLADGHRDECSAQDSTDTPQHGEQRRLQKELPPDIASSRSKGHPDADFLCALNDRHEHDIGDHDRAHDEGDARDQDHDSERRGRNRTPERLDGLRSDHSERVVATERHLAQRAQERAHLPFHRVQALHALCWTHKDRDPL